MPKVSKLSVLQKNLLEDALQAHYRGPADIACRSPDPGCFTLKTAKRRATAEERQEKANRRSAAGRAIARLVQRKLVEPCSRGHWRLSAAGFEVAHGLYPEVKPLSKRELGSLIAWRKTLQARKEEHPAISGSRRRRRGKALSPQAPKRIEAAKAEPGIEIELDY